MNPANPVILSKKFVKVSCDINYKWQILKNYLTHVGLVSYGVYSAPLFLAQKQGENAEYISLP